MALIEQGNTWSRITGLPQEVVGDIDRVTSYPTPAAQTGTWQPPEAVMGEEVWNGWIHLCRFPAPGTVVLPSGLLDLAEERLAAWRVTSERIDHRQKPDPGVPERGELPLRAYQRKAVEALLAAGQGVLDMPPRSGKTMTMLEALRCLALPALWVVPTLNIARQTVRAADGFFGRNWAVHVSGKAAAMEAGMAMTVVTTADTAASMPQEFYARQQVLVLDECFPAGTMVGAKRIEDLRVGDLVPSFDRESGHMELRQVLRVLRRPAPTALVTVHAGGREVRCTPNHHIWTQAGWKDAGLLVPGLDMALCAVVPHTRGDKTNGPEVFVRGVRAGVLPEELDQADAGSRGVQPGLSGGACPSTTKGGYGSVCGVRGTSPLPRAHGFGARPAGASLLLQTVSDDTPAPCVFSDYGGNQSALRIGAYETQESHVGSEIQGPSNDRAPVGGMATPAPRFIVTGANTTSDAFGVNTGLGDGGGCGPLADRRGQPGIEDRVGGGWSHASGVEHQSPRQAEDCGLEWVRVDRVEVHQQGSPDRSGGVSSDGFVYDLEVEGLHTYVADGFVVSNCHHQAAATWRAISQKCPHVFYRFGMSGTFFRSGNDELAMRSVISKVAYQVTAQELVEQGYLVPGRVVFLPVTCARVPSSPGKPFQAGVGRNGIFRNEYRTQLTAWAAATLWSRKKRTVVLVGTKEQGWAVTELLERFLPPEPGGGFHPVEFVSTDRPSKLCEEVIASFVSGKAPHILVGTSMIGEGTDLPDSDALVYAMGGKAEVSHTQASYRVITAVPGKGHAVIVDFADRHNDTLMRHSMERLSTYYGQALFQTEVLQDVGQLPMWLDRQGEGTQQMHNP